MTPNEERINRAADSVERFHGELSGVLGAIKSKVEVLVAQAKAPQAVEQPEDLSQELDRLDMALDRLAGVAPALRAASGIGGGPTTQGVTPIVDQPGQNPPTGTGPEGGTVAPVGAAPVVPNQAAPGSAATPFGGSQDMGPGGGGPALPQGGFKTTLSGEQPVGAGSTFQQGTDAPISSPGQGGTPPQQVFPQGPASATGTTGDSVPAPVTQGPKPEQTGPAGSGQAGGEGAGGTEEAQPPSLGDAFTTPDDEGKGTGGV